MYCSFEKTEYKRERARDGLFFKKTHKCFWCYNLKRFFAPNHKIEYEEMILVLKHTICQCQSSDQFQKNYLFNFGQTLSNIFYALLFRLLNRDLIHLIANKISPWPDMNWISLVSEATALPTDPQLLPTTCYYFLPCCKWT